MNLLQPQLMQFAADISAILAASYIQFFIRFKSGWIEAAGNQDFSDAIYAALGLIIYWIPVFWLSGLYRNWYLRSPFEETFSILQVSFFGSFVIFFFVFLEGRSPRLLFLIYFLEFSLCLVLFRYFIRIIQRKLRRLGLIKIPAIIFASKDKIKDIRNLVANTHWLGYDIIDEIIYENKKFENQNLNDNYLSNNSEFIETELFEKLIAEKNPKEILISVTNADQSLIFDITTLCTQRKIVVKIVPDSYDLFTGLVRTLPIYGLPLIEITPELLRPWEAFLKRGFDILGSFLVIILGIPFSLIISLLIKLDSKGPVFYRQERVGKNGKKFMIYKFRSMIMDAEKNGAQWATLNDPRVTKLGRFLRKYHIDEVPQFLNVFKADMSIVGPRPEQTELVEKFSSQVQFYTRRLVVRPGITGWWQVKYTAYEETREEILNRLKDDFYYIEKFSLKLDLEIIIRTAFIMIKGHGQT